MINLNDEEFDSKITKIFNSGIAGRSRCHLSSVDAKSESDNEKSPDFKVVFKDSSGGSVNMPFWFLDENHEYYSENLNRDGKKMKHLVSIICGANVEIAKADNATTLLKNVMGMINAKIGKELHIMTTYGTNKKTSLYLNIRSFTPFIESIDVEESKTSLSFLNFEAQLKLEGTNGSEVVSETTEEVDWAE